MHGPRIFEYNTATISISFPFRYRQAKWPEVSCGMCHWTLALKPNSANLLTNPQLDSHLFWHKETGHSCSVLIVFSITLQLGILLYDGIEFSFSYSIMSELEKKTYSFFFIYITICEQPRMLIFHVLSHANTYFLQL